MNQSLSKKGVSPSSSGKKFIQARLPFKLVSASPAIRLTSSASTTPLVTEAAADAAATTVTQPQHKKPQSFVHSPIALKLPGADTRKRKLSSTVTKDDLEICPSAKINKISEIICLDSDKECEQQAIKDTELSKSAPTNKRCSTRQSKSLIISAAATKNESNIRATSRTVKAAVTTTTTTSPAKDATTNNSSTFVIKLSTPRNSATKKSLKTKSSTKKPDKQTNTNIVEVIDSESSNLDEKLSDKLQISHTDNKSSEIIETDLDEEKPTQENKCESMDVSLIEQNSTEPNETSESDEKNTSSSKDGDIVVLDSESNEDGDNLNTPNKKAKLNDECSTPSTTDSKTTTKKKAGSEKKQLDRQKAKELREKKLQEEKEMRKREREERESLRKKEREDKENQKRREREEKEDQRRREREEKEDQKRKEREEKEEQRRQEKELRDQKRQAELDAKNEERRRQDEEKLAKEEAVIKKKQQEVEAFTKFFVQPSKDNVKKIDEQLTKATIDVETQQNNNFMPFRVKGNMKLAPIVRRNLSLTEKKNLENVAFDSKAVIVNKKDKDQLYLSLLLGKTIKPECSTKTWPNEENDVICVDDELEGAAAVIEEPSHKQKFRAKFYKFDENRRPPFYGTWRKQSQLIKPRKPFALDSKYFDYEVDSDDEWEGEEPGGESLHGSDDEKDKESDDDYDIDNEFFVPHGHLSDEELMDGDGIDDDDNSPAAQKAKLKIIQKEFADEMGKKTEKIKPRVIGLIWQDRNGDKPDTCPNVIWELLKKRRMIYQGDCIQLQQQQQPQQIQSGGTTNCAGIDSDGDDENVDVNIKSSTNTNPNQLQRIQQFTDTMTKDLIQLIHGNINNKGFIVQEFRAYLMKQQKTDDENYKLMSMNNIRGKMTKIAKYGAYPEEGEFYCKYFWYVLPDVQKEYGVDFGLPNAWNYILKKDTKEKKIPLVIGGDVNGGVVDTATTQVSSSSTGGNKEVAEESSKQAVTTEVSSMNEEQQNEQNSSTTKLLKSKPPSSLGNIAKFTKILNEDDKKKQFAAILTTDKMVNVLTPKRTGPNVGGGGGGDGASSSTRNDSDDVIIISDAVVKQTTSSTKKTSNLMNSQKIPLISKFLQINNSKSTSSLMKPISNSKEQRDSSSNVD